MPRHSLPSSGLPERGTSRHSLAESVDDSPSSKPAGQSQLPGRHPAATRAEGLRHAAEPVGRHATSTQAAIPSPSTGSAAEPVTARIPVVRMQPEQAPVPDETSTDATSSAVAPTRAARRHAAPQRHSRRAAGRTDDTSRPGKGRRILAGFGGSRRTAAVLLTAAVVLVALPTVSSASVDQCRWQVAAHDLLVSLDGQTDTRSTQLRRALTRAGVGTTIPAECAGQAADQAGSTAPTTSAPRTHTPRTTAPKPAPTTPAAPPKTATAPTTAPTAPPSTTTTAPAPTAAGTGTGTTAAAALGWGTPTKSDDFSAGLGQWGIYNGSGHAGNGRRTTSAVTTANGIMTMTGDTSGNTGGMAWGDGQKYGRWEARVKSTTGSYHSVMLLWPDAENWPVGGEVDWMEISDSSRQVADTFLHYGASNSQVQGKVNVDATQWHNWAVEWTPQGITTFLDGKPWWSTKNTSILPPGPMHMTIQLDNFGGRNTTTQMQVDWVKQYAL